MKLPVGAQVQSQIERDLADDQQHQEEQRTAQGRDRECAQEERQVQDHDSRVRAEHQQWRDGLPVLALAEEIGEVGEKFKLASYAASRPVSLRPDPMTHTEEHPPPRRKTLRIATAVALAMLLLGGYISMGMRHMNRVPCSPPDQPRPWEYAWPEWDAILGPRVATPTLTTLPPPDMRRTEKEDELIFE